MNNGKSCCTAPKYMIAIDGNVEKFNQVVEAVTQAGFTTKLGSSIPTTLGSDKSSVTASKACVIHLNLYFVGSFSVSVFNEPVTINAMHRPIGEALCLSAADCIMMCKNGTIINKEKTDETFK